MIDAYQLKARTYNDLPLMRFILWKKGFFANKSSLPSLLSFE